MNLGRVVALVVRGGEEPIVFNYTILGTSRSKKSQELLIKSYEHICFQTFMSKQITQKQKSKRVEMELRRYKVL